MAMDTPAKRYSAMNLAMPWRGTNIVPDVAFPQGERQAADYMYSGILASGPTPPVASTTNEVRVGMVRSAYISENPSIGGQF